MNKFLFLLLLSFALLQASAQTPVRAYIADPGIAPRERVIDFTRLHLQLWPLPATGSVRGIVTHYFKPLRPSLDSFFIDGIDMTVRSLELNGQKVKYRVDNDGITIFPATPLKWDTDDSLVISYEASPKRGLYFIGWNDPNNLSRKQIWSQGEGIDNRRWIPMYDERNEKLITETTITFDKDYQVLSNGLLVDKKDNPDKTITWSYKMDHAHAPYLIMLGIGKYNIKETHSTRGTPMHLYYYPDYANRVSPTYQYSEQMLDFYEKEIGVNYPWESYSQIPVQDYMFGAMENTTATIFGDFYLFDQRGILDRNYISVNAHELAHQWFGDYVTAHSESDQWLQESFATYYSQLFERSIFGDDYFSWSRRGNANGAIQESLHNKLGVGQSASGGARIYGKGAFVLDMLKNVVGGREAYNRAIKYYLEKYPYKNVDSHDLLIAFEESTGQPLEWFWDEWIYRGGEPDFRVTLNDQELVVEQTQELSDLVGYKNGLYKMPVKIEAHYTDGAVAAMTVWIEKQTEIIKIPNREHLSYILFDEGSEVIKTVSFPKPFSMLQAQALDATALLDRYDALVAMRHIPTEKKRDLLQKIYHKEVFHVLRTEALSQLSADSATTTTTLFEEALLDTSAIIRKAAIANIDPHGPMAQQLLPKIEKKLNDPSYDMVDATLQKLYTLHPAGMAAYLKTTKGIEGNIGRNVEVRWMELSWIRTHKAQYADQLVRYTGESYEFRTRGNAMTALRRMNYFTPILLANLVNGILSPNDRLSRPAADLLRYFYAQDNYKTIISAYIRANHKEPAALGEFAQ